MLIPDCNGVLAKKYREVKVKVEVKYCISPVSHAHIFWSYSNHEKNSSHDGT